MIKLFDHQKKVLEETKDQTRVAYYLDMGLGKTFVGSEKLDQLGSKINIVVCQKSKLEDWEHHFKLFYPEYKTTIIQKTLPEFEPDKTYTLIINYDLIWRRPQLLDLSNFTLMLDESSMIKNLTSNRTKFILKLKAENIILLSGTPIAGKYEELYSQIKLLNWKISKQQFYKHYILTKKINIGGFKIDKVIGYKNIERLKRKLKEHGAIFMKTEEVFKLPDTTEIIKNIKVSADYKKFTRDKLITIEDQELVGDTVLNEMLYQRQIAGQYNKNKFDTIKDLLESTEDRLIIFYNFKGEHEKLIKMCEALKKPVSSVNGDGSDLSNYETFDNSVTLIQYQSGAMGLNLQKSNKIIYFSLPLRSELFEQSKKRTHRIGQDRPCFYYYLITKGTIEEKIYKVLEQRRDYTNELFKEN